MAFKYTSHVKAVMKDIRQADKANRKKAANHVKSKIRNKINKSEVSLPGHPPGKDSGDLLKGLSTKNGRSTSIVGFKKPGFHARILEFGALRKGTNRLEKRPVIGPTFAEESGAVKRILSGDWNV